MATAAVGLLVILLLLGVAGWRHGILKPVSVREREFVEEKARRNGISGFFVKDGVVHDSVELGDAYKKSVGEAERLAKAQTGFIGSGPLDDGFFAFEDAKKRILKERYHLDWRNLTEMNPWILTE